MPDTKPKSATTTGDRRDRPRKLVFLGLFLPIAVLVVLVGISVASLRIENRIKEVLDDDASRLTLVSGFLGAEVLASLQHLRSLITESVTLEAVNTPDAGRLQALQSSFMTLAQRNPQYQQIRWIDQAGIEKARIVRDQGEPFAVAPQDLRDESGRYYFKEANALLPGELYISRIDLNEVEGRIENPPRPILRIASPVKGSGRKHLGIIVINIDMKYLFDLANAPLQANAAPDVDTNIEYFLLNQQGIQLNGELADLEGDGEGEQSLNFTRAYPKIWEEILASDSGNLKSPDGLWSWETLSPVETFYRSTQMLPKHMVAFDQMISNDFSLTLLVHRPPDILNEVRYENRLLISLGIISILSVYGLSLYFYLSGQARLRRAEVDAAYAMARASSLARMKELEERFHLLVEASSVGQLVVDGAGRIEICNPAAERMLGYARGELQGRLVDTLLPEGMQQQHAQMREQFMQAPEARRMGVGRELQAVRKDGTTVSVEVGLNPYSDHGRQLILASIIDLSNRDGLSHTMF